MKSKTSMLIVAVMFLVIAIAFGIVIWRDTSLSAKIAFFALGFGSGISTGVWFARRGA